MFFIYIYRRVFIRTYQVGDAVCDFPGADVFAVLCTSQDPTEHLHHHAQAVAFVSSCGHNTDSEDTHKHQACHTDRPHMSSAQLVSHLSTLIYSTDTAALSHYGQYQYNTRSSHYITLHTPKTKSNKLWITVLFMCRFQWQNTLKTDGFIHVFDLKGSLKPFKVTGANVSKVLKDLIFMFFLLSNVFLSSLAPTGASIKYK